MKFQLEYIQTKLTPLQYLSQVPTTYSDLALKLFQLTDMQFYEKEFILQVMPNIHPDQQILPFKQIARQKIFQYGFVTSGQILSHLGQFLKFSQKYNRYLISILALTYTCQQLYGIKSLQRAFVCLLHLCKRKKIFEVEKYLISIKSKNREFQTSVQNALSTFQTFIDDSINQV